jgi:endonuclease/exonuclease/phosphatase family metal-dependent hydrolase
MSVEDSSLSFSDISRDRHGRWLTVMTYNVGKGLAAPEKLVPLMKTSGADVIGLQELDLPQAEAIERELGHEYPYQVMHAGGFAGKGLFSRYPIIESEQLHLYPARPDLRVVVDIGGQPLTVLVAHPPPELLSFIGLHFHPLTTAQIEMLTRIALACAPAILMGDFNMAEWQIVYNQVKTAGLLDAFRGAGIGRGSTLPVRLGPWRRLQGVNRSLRWLPLYPLMRVDYIWHTLGLQAQEVWVGEDGGSDHLPVLARLALTV